MPRRASSGTEGLFKHHHCAHKPRMTRYLKWPVREATPEWVVWEGGAR